MFLRPGDTLRVMPTRDARARAAAASSKSRPISGSLQSAGIPCTLEGMTACVSQNRGPGEPPELIRAQLAIKITNDAKCDQLVLADVRFEVMSQSYWFPRCRWSIHGWPSTVASVCHPACRGAGAIRRTFTPRKFTSDKTEASRANMTGEPGGIGDESPGPDNII